MFGDQNRYSLSFRVLIGGVLGLWKEIAVELGDVVRSKMSFLDKDCELWSSARYRVVGSFFFRGVKATYVQQAEFDLYWRLSWVVVCHVGGTGFFEFGGEGCVRGGTWVCRGVIPGGV